MNQVVGLARPDAGSIRLDAGICRGSGPGAPQPARSSRRRRSRSTASPRARRSTWWVACAARSRRRPAADPGTRRGAGDRGVARHRRRAALGWREAAGLVRDGGRGTGPPRHPRRAHERRGPRPASPPLGPGPALAERGAAVLLVTHNVIEAERSVDRLAILDHGRVVVEGTPAELKAAIGRRAPPRARRSSRGRIGPWSRRSRPARSPSRTTPPGDGPRRVGGRGRRAGPPPSVARAGSRSSRSPGDPRGRLRRARRAGGGSPGSPAVGPEGATTDVRRCVATAC